MAAKSNSTAQESGVAAVSMLRAAALRTMIATEPPSSRLMANSAITPSAPNPPAADKASTLLALGKRVAYESVDQLAALSVSLLQHVNELDAGDDEVAVLRAIAVRMVDLSNAAHVALTQGAATAECEGMVLRGQPWA